MTIHHTVYKITNLLNNKIYIGVHKTTNLDDGYMGSGKIIKMAIEKNGIDNFKKEILYVFNTSDEAYDIESSIVTEEFIRRPDTYNIQVGGTGGWEHIIPGTYQLSPEIRKKIGDKLKGRKHTEDAKEKMSYARKKYISTDPILVNGMEGKFHTDKTKLKMAERKVGKNNPNFGKICITNGITNQKINKEEIIPNGWYRGLTVSDETKRKQSEAAKARVVRDKTVIKFV